MKFFSTLFFLSFSVLALSAAVSKPSDSEFEVAKRQIEDGAAHYIPAVLPNGKKAISVYNGDVLEGSIAEGENGEVIVYDAFGNVIDEDELNDEEGGVEKRQSRFTILRKFASFIRKFGARAWVSDGQIIGCWLQFCRALY